jgi:hypothetical protein
MTTEVPQSPTQTQDAEPQDPTNTITTLCFN